MSAETGASHPDAPLTDWIGRSRESEDIATPRLVASFKATLAPHAAHAGRGIAPPGLHWCLAPDIAEAGELGPDGHPAKGGFLPPVALPRRMWASSDVRYLNPIRIGDTITRRSTIVAVQEKSGRSGALVFVTVRHELRSGAGPVVGEDQHIVYREAASAAGAAAADAPTLPSPTHKRSVAVDPVLLFRYSALTFNGHRIHFDHPYAVEVEHYPGLVIHGPLQATLLVNFAAGLRGEPPRRFFFRARQPATGAQQLVLRAASAGDSGLALAVIAAGDRCTMTAEAQW